MSVSYIIKFRMEKDRNAAMALECAVNGVKQTSGGVL